MAKILVVDDEEKICIAFEHFIEGLGHRPFVASNVADALLIVEKQSPEIVFLDIRLPGESGMDMLEKLNSERFPGKVIVMTAYGNIDTAINAMQKGAYEYLTKPIDLDRAQAIVEEILCSCDVEVLPVDFVSASGKGPSDVEIIGKSACIQDIYKLIGLLTTNDVPVLIEGESGVGKELAAKSIHFNSKRKHFPFVAINCGAMPENLLETELFGHEKGAFTGADSEKIGKFEHAGQGTIFLDEIAELNAPMQAKLLRVLQEKLLTRVGGLQLIPVKARIVAATNKKLAEEVRSGAFRKDLYYRLQLISLNIPPLRERKEDIPLLVNFFIRRANEEIGTEIKSIESRAVEHLAAYDWPGNVRELENTVKRAAIVARGDCIGMSHIGPLESGGAGKASESGDRIESAVRDWFRRRASKGFSSERIHKDLIEAVEKTLFLEALEYTGSNQVKTCAILGMNRTTFRKKIKEYGLE